MSKEHKREIFKGLNTNGHWTHEKILRIISRQGNEYKNQNEVSSHLGWNGISKNQNPINTERMCGKTYHDPLLVGIETNIAILDDRMETLRKFEN